MLLKMLLERNKSLIKFDLINDSMIKGLGSLHELCCIEKSAFDTHMSSDDATSGKLKNNDEESIFRQVYTT